jgi:hypothetical protein
MIEISPKLVFGSYRPGEWISRYARFRVDLAAGRHRLMGRTYNPTGLDLVDNRLQIIVQRGLVGEVRPADPPEWRDFSFDLPEIETPKSLDIVLRTTRFRAPEPPDKRLLGLLLDRLTVMPQAD